MRNSRLFGFAGVGNPKIGPTLTLLTSVRVPVQIRNRYIGIGIFQLWVSVFRYGIGMPRIATHYWILVPILGIKKCEKTQSEYITNRLCKVEGVPYFQSALLRLVSQHCRCSRPFFHQTLRKLSAVSMTRMEVPPKIAFTRTRQTRKT